MKIESIKIYKYNLSLHEPFVISIGKYDSATNILIKIKTDENITGIGEASPLVNLVGETQESEYEIAKSLAVVLKGKNPLEIEDRIADLDKAIWGNYSIKSAFDMALYDIAAKKANLPLYRFLGGSKNKELISDMTVSIDTPEKMASDAKKFVQKGFPSIKLKLGGSTKEDYHRVKAVREAIGEEIALRIDANQAWDASTAIKTLKAIKEFNIDHCEEPVAKWNNKALKKVSDNSPISIMADESVFTHHDALKLASDQACDYFNIKLSKSGGINTALKIVAVAEAAGIKSQVGCMLESRVGLTALAHFAVSRSNIVHFDIDSSLMHSEDPVIGGIRYEGKGKWTVNDTPGLGVDVDENFLKNLESVEI